MKAPGAIVLIGVAVFLIVIGATDKANDVWNAIRGVTGGENSPIPAPGGSGKNGPDLTLPPEHPPPLTTCSEGEMQVLPLSGEANYCCPKQEVGAGSQGADCPSGYTKVSYKARSDAADQFGCVRLKNCHLRGTGQGGYGRMNVARLPTGLTGFRHAPNI